MKTLTSPRAMQKLSQQWQSQGHRVGFVPTMGYLHAGHGKLLEKARKNCDRLVLSIFVNPLQFGPNEDFATYPRDDRRDRALARQHGVDALFYPTPATMYPPGHSFRVHPGPMGDCWEGAHRPGFFTGVSTVVLKLFTAVAPHDAWFGLKDFQQFTLMKKMVADLDLPLRLHGVPTVREHDGLALSSRNVYLSAKQRQDALCLVRAIRLGQKEIAAGATGAENVRRKMLKLIEATPGAGVDYVAIVNPDTLEPVKTITAPVRLLLAVRLGRTRLIDNDEAKPSQKPAPQEALQ